jgi:thiol-disulfide isomerase/thioredoxin
VIESRGWPLAAIMARIAIDLSLMPALCQPLPTTLSLLGQPASGFLVTSLDGRPVSLAEYRGKAVLVNFWATWCGNCKFEMPWPAELREK